MPIELIDKIKPKNSGTFAMVDAADVEMEDGTRLQEAIDARPLIVMLTNTEYQALVEAGEVQDGVVYMIARDSS